MPNTAFSKANHLPDLPPYTETKVGSIISLNSQKQRESVYFPKCQTIPSSNETLCSVQNKLPLSLKMINTWTNCLCLKVLTFIKTKMKQMNSFWLTRWPSDLVLSKSLSEDLRIKIIKLLRQQPSKPAGEILHHLKECIQN